MSRLRRLAVRAGAAAIALGLVAAPLPATATPGFGAVVHEGALPYPAHGDPSIGADQPASFALVCNLGVSDTLDITPIPPYLQVWLSCNGTTASVAAIKAATYKDFNVTLRKLKGTGGTQTVTLGSGGAAGPIPSGDARHTGGPGCDVSTVRGDYQVCAGAYDLSQSLQYDGASSFTATWWANVGCDSLTAIKPAGCGTGGTSGDRIDTSTGSLGAVSVELGTGYGVITSTYNAPGPLSYTQSDFWGDVDGFSIVVAHPAYPGVTVGDGIPPPYGSGFSGCKDLLQAGPIHVGGPLDGVSYSSFEIIPAGTTVTMGWQWPPGDPDPSRIVITGPPLDHGYTTDIPTNPGSVDVTYERAGTLSDLTYTCTDATGTTGAPWNGGVGGPGGGGGGTPPGVGQCLAGAGFGINPSTWLPALAGLLGCVVQALFVPTDLSQLSELWLQVKVKAPVSFVYDLLSFLPNAVTALGGGISGGGCATPPGTITALEANPAGIGAAPCTVSNSYSSGSISTLRTVMYAMFVVMLSVAVLGATNRVIG